MALSRAMQKDVKQRENIKNVEKLLDLKILKPGDAVNFPKQGDSVSVHYKGFLEDGTCIDDSFERGQPVYFVLGAEQVLKGFEVVLPVLSRGEKARITLTHDVGACIYNTLLF
jgi:FK506-binding protein 1